MTQDISLTTGIDGNFAWKIHYSTQYCTVLQDRNSVSL